MALLFAASLGVLLYVYVAYPLLLRLVVRFRGARVVRRSDTTPPLSLVISAFNEEAVIRAKIENALGLDYPADCLEIVVVSDASSDATDAIVAEYAPRVRLARQSARRGKTAGLNHTVPTLRGDIVVFSDANAIYEPDALRKLARNFADPCVGCVTGEARYLPEGRSAADVGERVYWDYEMQIKRLETAVGSMVGGDGAIYAIRRSLWRDLPVDAINDFLNPLQIVAAGWRGVYEPEAVCYEETAGGVRTEWRRRIRIVSRSWRAVFQAPQVLNPFVVGLFAWSVVSHKVLRWLGGAFAVCAAIAGAALFGDAVASSPAMSLAVVAVTALAAVATASGRRGISMAGYFMAISSASLVGVWKGMFGRVSGVWSTPRQTTTAAAPPRIMLPVGRLLLAMFAIGILLLITAGVSDRVGIVVFWTSSLLLGYVYVGYPILLAMLRPLLQRPVRGTGAQPRVCVLIAANDEDWIIESKLVNTLALDYPMDRLDVLVVSDGSVDGTNAIVRRFAPRVRLLELSPRRGKIAAINAGMQSVSSEIVVFSDANTFLEADAISALVRNFADDRVGAVSGDVVLIGERAALGPSEDLYYRYERWVQQAESHIGSMIGADGALYAIRRDLFAPPPDDTILDDMAIPMGVVRAGRRVVFDGSARAFEHGSQTAMEEFTRKTRVVAGAMQFMSRPDSDVPLRTPQAVFSMMSHKALRWWSPAFATGALVSSIALAGSSPWYAVPAVAQASLLVVGLAGCAPALRRISPVSLAHYFCLVQAAAAFGLLRWLSGRQSVLWQRFGRGPVTRSESAA
jgi:cellulose synthase/poly-beta-1,6-N-acetylglucosamine synthase-like glycosyltransferase